MLVVALTAGVAAALTLFSGFGLGTLLLPAFLLTFPGEIAVAATAVVHLANNLFKLGLLGRHARLSVVLRFGLPAAACALLGALLLEQLGSQPPLATWQLGARTCRVTPIDLTLGLVIVAFALLELDPRASRLAFPPRLLPFGGALAGFFGGLSGHQGALRTAFLIRLDLPREAFLATGVVCAVAVDVVRLGVYGLALWGARFDRVTAEWPTVLAGIGAAFCGSYVGSRLIHKVTLRGLQLLVGAMLLLLGLGLASGMLGA